MERDSFFFSSSFFSFSSSSFPFFLSFFILFSFFLFFCPFFWQNLRGGLETLLRERDQKETKFSKSCVRGGFHFRYFFWEFLGVERGK